jgi:hypothetical protein
LPLPEVSVDDTRKAPARAAEGAFRASPVDLSTSARFEAVRRERRRALRRCGLPFAVDIDRIRVVFHREHGPCEV